MKQRLPYFVLAVCVLWLLSALRLPHSPSSFHLQEFGKLPALSGGRLKPMDTVARTSLLIIHGKQKLQRPGYNYPANIIDRFIDIIKGRDIMGATEWLADTMMKPELADTYPVFRIDHPDVLGLLGFQQKDKKYFSYQQIQPFLNEIERLRKLAEPIESVQRSSFQRDILKLYHQVDLYYRLKNSLRVEEDLNFVNELNLFEKAIPAGALAFRGHQEGGGFNQKDLDLLMEFTNRYEFLSQAAYIFVIPSPQVAEGRAPWISIGQSLLNSLGQQTIDPAVRSYATMITAYREPNAPAFNQSLMQFQEQLKATFPNELSKINFEFRFNHFQPFYKSMIFYVLVFILILLTWLKESDTLRRTAFYLLLLGFAIHTAGLISRMYLHGRPPVTNLYSSAIFVGWGSVLLGIILERIYRNGVGALTVSAMGFLTLLIAHHLSGDGDTLEMLRAVLDTNYWLATHVVVVTLGYASTFLAGFLAIVYIFRGFFTRSLDAATAQSLERMVYGIICFATLFSFTGTVLGGIWADQSWGRFWGWDPKENGALIIVLWNALILHARWGKLIGQQGLMTMVIFGNIVTIFSWLGVNMLGVGLHSYGFIDKAFMWLALFITSQLVIMGLGSLPKRYWQSFKNSPSL